MQGRTVFRNDLAWRSTSGTAEGGPQQTCFSTKTIKTPAKQLKWTILELWKLTRAPEQTGSHLSKRNYWASVRKWDLWYFNLWMGCYSHPRSLPGSICGSHKKPSVLQPMERTDLLWRSVKSNIPRVQSISCPNLQLPGKSLSLVSSGYLIWLRIQLSRKKKKKKALLRGHFQNNSHLLATLLLHKAMLLVGVSKR